MPNPEWFVGLMSGTSFDGIDVGLLRTDGVEIVECGATLTVPHPQSRKHSLASIMGRSSAPEWLVDEFTRANAEAVQSLLTETGVPSEAIRAIGFHGQTILHRPKEGVTVQVGDGAKLATLLGIDVVDQFRLADVAAGGEGAPLAPVFHVALLKGFSQPAALVNIGGIANVTWSDGTQIIACDTGPGNARLDDLMRERTGLDYDADGATALSGHVHEEIVAGCLRDPFFARKAPKSLDRDEIQVSGIDGLTTADAAATLTAITAEGIASIVPFLPRSPTTWIISGGGRLNRAILNRLHMRLSGRVLIAEEAGMNGDGMEAHLFAYLAARNLCGLPISFPGTTGVPLPMTGGVLRRAR